MRVGLLTSGDISKFRENTLAPILKDENFNVVIALEDKRPKKTFKQKLIKNFKRGRGGYMIVMAFNKIFAKSEESIDLDEFCRNYKIE